MSHHLKLLHSLTPLRMSYIQCLFGLSILMILAGCTTASSYVGLKRHELAAKPEVRLASGGDVRNGYSSENLAIHGVLYVANFKRVGSEWHNPEDVLLSLATVEESLKDTQDLMVPMRKW